MPFQFTHPYWLIVLPLAWAWVLWWTLRSDVQINAWRRWLASTLRLVIVTLLLLGIAGLQWKRPLEGVNVFFLLDRSDSIPSEQQEGALKYVNEAAQGKKKDDRGGILVFGTEAAIEASANSIVNVEKINAVVPTERTDISSAIRLGTAAFPETGQKRLVLLSDGNENLSDAMTALLSAQDLDVTLDVVPMGVQRVNDVSVQRLGLPSRVKKGQTFDTRIFVNADRAQSAKVRIMRNQQILGEQSVELARGKNLFTFPQTLEAEGFYTYSAFLDTASDNVPQNNQANGFVTVARGEPLVLVVSGGLDPNADLPLIAALKASRLQLEHIQVDAFPETLQQIQDYDAIFLSNVAAGDLGEPAMRLLESAVRDFGVGLVCIGGDQTYAAGGYRGTALERTLPLSMELDSKKVLPNGAVALVMHGMEFNNGNQVARDCALGVLDALGPRDEMGVVLWDGQEKWLFPMTKAGDKKTLGSLIAGMNQGDLPSFQGVMSLAYEGLKKSTAHLKHMIVFSDGDPGEPSAQLMQNMVADKITVSTVLISGHAGPERMQKIAALGRGRFYDIQNPSQLPQIFIKEAAIILKSAIFEDPFFPKLESNSELVRGIDGYPQLLGYVCTTPKPRAEIPLVSDKGDPVLGHWQYGLGRAVAFTSDAKAKWAKNWMAWPQYRQFWAQTAHWSLRRLDTSDFTTEVTIDQGEGHLTVEAIDAEGNYRNFLYLQATVVGPDGENTTIHLEQTGPGHYEAQFATKEVGAYLLNLLELRDGKVASSQVVGASVNYSPEFSASAPNVNLLKRLAEVSGGKTLDPRNPTDNPFLHDRQKTYQPVDWWEWLFKWSIILFVLDVGIRRIQLGREEWEKALAWSKRTLLFWQSIPRTADSDQSLSALLARRDQVRAARQTTVVRERPELFEPQQEGFVQKTLDEPPSVENKPLKSDTQSKVEKPAVPESSTASRLLEAKRRARKRLE